MITETADITTPKSEPIASEETLQTYARRCIVTYFQQMMSYKQGCIAGNDGRFVHDMRVTARRLRTAMDDFAACFPQRPFTQYSKKIKRITRTLGAVRDLDVLIARFENELDTLSEQEQQDIRAVIAHLSEERVRAREPMVQLFEGMEATGFETAFLTFFGEAE